MKDHITEKEIKDIESEIKMFEKIGFNHGRLIS